MGGLQYRVIENGRPIEDDRAVGSVEIGNHSDDRTAPRLDDILASWLNLDGGFQTNRLP